MHSLEQFHALALLILANIMGNKLWIHIDLPEFLALRPFCERNSHIFLSSFVN